MGTDEQESPNWVAERAKCDMERLFDELGAVVKQNTEWANTVPNAPGYPAYVYGRQSRDAFMVRKNGDTRVFSLSRRQQAVHVSGTEIRLYTITTRWDAKKSKCRVVVAQPAGDTVEFPHKHLWKVVQYILEPFFFEDPDKEPHHAETPRTDI